jgi:2,4-dienoyl-CoA reductase-like NADH-dependent reductase (Old Yellow Enzyme family)
MEKQKQTKEEVKTIVEVSQEILPTKKPSETLRVAREIAKAVADVVEKRKLYSVIQGKKYVQCEGWTTMGAMLGLFPQIVEVKEERSDKGVKYIAVCEIRTSDGRLISRAESECASWEKNKEKQEEYAIRSMAETRAVSKAYRICLSWIMSLAGYEPTPAEEMVINGQVVEQKVVDVPVPKPETTKKTEKKQEKIFE